MASRGFVFPGAFDGTLRDRWARAGLPGPHYLNWSGTLVRAKGAVARDWLDRPNTLVRAAMLSLLYAECKETEMEVTARLSSKGQVTVPRAVREALSLEQGDRVVFRVVGDHAVLARTADLLALAGSVTVPAAKRATPWADVLRQTRRARAERRR